MGPALNGTTVEFEWLRYGEGACGDLGPVPLLPEGGVEAPPSPVKLHTAARRGGAICAERPAPQQAAAQAAGNYARMLNMVLKYAIRRTRGARTYLSVRGPDR